MEKVKEFKNLIFILLGIMIATLSFPVGVKASGNLYPITFEISNQIAGIQSRELSLWKLDDDLIRSGKLEDLLEDYKSMSKAQLIEALGQPRILKANKDDLNIKADLEAGYYIGLDELVADEVYTAFMSFMVGQDYPKVLKSKLQITDTPSELILKKVDGDGKVLEGVGFVLYFGKDNPANPSSELTEVGLKEKENTYDPNGESRVLYTDAKGEIRVTGLPAGSYVFREVEALEGYSIENKDNTFIVEPGENKEITIVNKKGGGFNFIKLDGKTNDPLKGARFVVTEKVGDKYKRVKRDGLDLVVESDENGLFKVDDLPFGKYYLWELEAPEGYKVLTEPIEFEVGGGTKEIILPVENFRKPLKPPKGPPDEPPEVPPNEPPERPPLKPPLGPPDEPPTGPPDIPETGDIAFLILTITGLLLITGGNILIRSGKKEESI